MDNAPAAVSDFRVPVPAHGVIAGVLPQVALADGVVSLIEPTVVRRDAPQGLRHALRRVRPASMFKGVFMSMSNGNPFASDASLTPRPETSGDAFPEAFHGAFHGASRSEYPAPDSAVPPASSSAPARGLAGDVSEHDAQVGAQATSPVERALYLGPTGPETKLAFFTRRLGLHGMPGDAGSDTPVGSVDVPASSAQGASADMRRAIAARAAQPIAHAGAPAIRAWTLARANREVRP